jgi:DNA-binding MarR family transcriptional regulator/N-acetylglutamate synthase-like GNAT family acetyltransferase
MAAIDVDEDRVAAIRAFNRFYTTVIGLLGEGYLDTSYSLTEVRLIFEMGRRDVAEVAELRRELGIDAGYLSRILARLESGGLVARTRSGVDARRQVATLTARGRSLFGVLDSRSSESVRELLTRVPAREQRRLLGAMELIRRALEPGDAPGAFRLREPAPGELGWIVERHGALYATDQGWDERFEALAARVVADFVDHRDLARERAWIAEVDGRPAGCVLCVAEDVEVARLRLLLVEPWARGIGVGAGLIEECAGFARRAGYRRMTLWTASVLVEARRLYERAGFTVVDEGRERRFGHDLVFQTWELRL